MEVDDLKGPTQTAGEEAQQVTPPITETTNTFLTEYLLLRPVLTRFYLSWMFVRFDWMERCFRGSPD